MSTASGYTAVHNAADKNQVQAAESRAARQHRKYLENLRDVLKSKAGRAVIWELIDYCGVHRTTLDVNPHQMYANEGRRNVGLRLMRQIVEADPNALVSLMSEAAAEDIRRGLEQEQELARQAELDRQRGDAEEFSH